MASADFVHPLCPRVLSLEIRVVCEDLDAIEKIYASEKKVLGKIKKIRVLNIQSATFIVVCIGAIIAVATYYELTTKSPKLECDIQVSFGELDHQKWTLTETATGQENGKPYCDEKLKITVFNSGNIPASGVSVEVDPRNFEWGLLNSWVIHSGKTLEEGKIMEYDWGPLASGGAFSFEVVIKIDLGSVKTASERDEPYLKPYIKVFVSSTEENVEKFIKLQVKTFDNQIIP